MRYLKLVLSLILVVLTMACAHVVPSYSESVDNANKLQRARAGKVQIGQFTGPQEAQKLQSRANSFSSPYNDSFSEYIREALRLELGRAGLLAPNARIVIEGELIKNKLDISGFDIGAQEIAVRFIVRRNKVTAYNRIKSVKHQWQSSFVRAVAIPLARDAYPEVVTKLLAKLFAD